MTIRLQRVLTLTEGGRLTGVLSPNDLNYQATEYPSGTPCGPCQCISLARTSTQSIRVDLRWLGPAELSLRLVNAFYDNSVAEVFSKVGETSVSVSIPDGAGTYAVIVGLSNSPSAQAFQAPQSYELTAMEAVR